MGDKVMNVGNKSPNESSSCSSNSEQALDSKAAQSKDDQQDKSASQSRHSPKKHKQTNKNSSRATKELIDPREAAKGPDAHSTRGKRKNNITASNNANPTSDNDKNGDTASGSTKAQNTQQSTKSKKDGASTLLPLHKELKLAPEAIVLHPNVPPQAPWQHILNNILANNSSRLVEAFCKMALVEFTPLSANGLYLIVNKRKTTGISQLFTELQDEKTKQVLKHNAIYKSFWFTDSKSDADEEATGESLAVVKTLVSYVPRVVVRRFVKEPGRPIRAPEVESYYACVLFADISGFTPLTESLNTLGAEGVETVTTHLNNYFGTMIDMIASHGGDIVKFAGDALMVIWPTDTEEGLTIMSQLACQCALALQKDMGRYVVGEAELRLHIGMGAGKIYGIHVGGAQGRLEFFVAGHPIDQYVSAEEQALPGQIFISPELHAIVREHALGEFVEASPKEPLSPSNHSPGSPSLSPRRPNFRLDAWTKPIALPPVKEMPKLKILEQRLKSYVPGAVLSHLDTHEYLAELRTVSVLFVNLNICWVNEVESPMQIQLAVAGMQAILARYEGTVRQFLVDDKGSVLIAAFGLPPLAHEDDSTRAVEAALDIYKLLVSLKINPSIGVTTGRAFCGAVGNESRREYAMVGDIVNLSARLMVAARTRGGILCDETTYQNSKATIKFDVLEPISVKGKKRPVPIYYPTGKRNNVEADKSGPTLMNVASRTSNQFIGRKNVVALAEYKLSQLKVKAHQPGHVLVIEGDAGMGKSRLIHEIRGMLGPDEEVFVGVGDQLNGAQAYYGSWSVIFNAVLDLGSLEDDADVGSYIHNLLEQIPKSFPLPDRVPDWPSLAPLLNAIFPGINLKENSVTNKLTDQSRAEALQLLLIRLLQTAVAPGSVIILEDAHYFDSNSWTLTLAAAQQLKGVLFVITARPMKPPTPFAYQQIMHCENASHVYLQPLTPEESIALAKHFLQVTDLPDSLAQQFVEKGQGVPFIIEELANKLRDEGIVYMQNGVCKVKEGVQIELPSKVNKLITSKIDKLTASQKSILKVASVIGKVFNVSLLRELLPGNPTMAEVMADLAVLEKAGFVTPERAQQTTNPQDDPVLLTSRSTEVTTPNHNAINTKKYSRSGEDEADKPSKGKKRGGTKQEHKGQESRKKHETTTKEKDDRNSTKASEKTSEPIGKTEPPSESSSAPKKTIKGDKDVLKDTKESDASKDKKPDTPKDKKELHASTNTKKETDTAKDKKDSHTAKDKKDHKTSTKDQKESNATKKEPTTPKDKGSSPNVDVANSDANNNSSKSVTPTTKQNDQKNEKATVTDSKPDKEVIQESKQPRKESDAASSAAKPNEEESDDDGNMPREILQSKKSSPPTKSPRPRPVRERPHIPSLRRNISSLRRRGILSMQNLDDIAGSLDHGTPHTLEGGSARGDYDTLRKYRTISRKFTFRSNTLRGGSILTGWPFEDYSSDATGTPRNVVTSDASSQTASPDTPKTNEVVSPLSGSATALPEYEVDEYSFRNEMIMEVVYNMMLFGQRRGLHAQIAKWYETNHAQNVTAFASILGYHWKLSEQNLKKAIYYYTTAGEQAQRNFSNQEAVQFFTEALQLSKKVTKSRQGIMGAMAGQLRRSQLRTDDANEIHNLVLLHRKLGQAYYNLGNFNSANDHLRQALKLVKVSFSFIDQGKKIPTVPDDRILKDLSGLMSNSVYVLREIVLALLSMAKVNYYACNLRTTTYCNILALTIADKAKLWEEQGEAYAQCIVTAGLAGHHELARKFMAEGKALAKDKLNVVSVVLLFSGVYYVSCAEWRLAMKCFKDCISTCQNTGDRRRLEEATVFLSLSYYLQGHFRKSLSAATKALDSARLRGDVQSQILALSAQVICHLSLGNVIKSSSKLDQIRVALNRSNTKIDLTLSPNRRESITNIKKIADNIRRSSDGDVSSDINYYALLAWVYYLKGEPAESLAHALLAEAMMSDKSFEPTTFFIFPAVFAIPDIYVCVLFRPSEWDALGVSRKKLLKHLNSAIQRLEEFSKLFAFAVPRLYLMQGFMRLSQGGNYDQQVLPLWNRALKQAQELQMHAESSRIIRHMSTSANNAVNNTEISSVMLFKDKTESSSKRTPKSRRHQPNSPRLLDSSEFNLPSSGATPTDSDVESTTISLEPKQSKAESTQLSEVSSRKHTKPKTHTSSPQKKLTRSRAHSDSSSGTEVGKSKDNRKRKLTISSETTHSEQSDSTDHPPPRTRTPKSKRNHIQTDEKPLPDALPNGPPITFRVDDGPKHTTNNKEKEKVKSEKIRRQQKKKHRLSTEAEAPGAPDASVETAH